MEDLQPYLDAVERRLADVRDALSAAGITVEVATEQHPAEAHIGSEIRLVAFDSTGNLIGVEEQWVRQGDYTLVVEEFVAPLSEFLDELLTDKPQEQ